jgi:hypothetical protein
VFPPPHVPPPGAVGTEGDEVRVGTGLSGAGLPVGSSDGLAVGRSEPAGDGDFVDGVAVAGAFVGRGVVAGGVVGFGVAAGVAVGVGFGAGVGAGVGVGFVVGAGAGDTTIVAGLTELRPTETRPPPVPLVAANE